VGGQLAKRLWTSWGGGGLMQVAAWGLDPKLAAAIVRAYNDWAASFVAHVPDRLLGVGQLDLRDVDAAVAEARRCVAEHGFRAFFVLPEPPLPGVTLERPYYDPLWSALEELEFAGVAREAVTVVQVPGAFELPLGAMALAKTRRFACIVALGCVIRGETPHFDYVAGEAASGLQLAAL